MNKEIYLLIKQLEEDNEIYVFCFQSLEKARERLNTMKNWHLEFYEKTEESEDFDCDIDSFKDYSEWVYARIEPKFIY